MITEKSLKINYLIYIPESINPKPIQIVIEIKNKTTGIQIAL
jgi:hypothetical protein